MKVVNGYEIKPFANLRGANLSGANLSGANLGGANLEGANLCRADLRDANLRDANLRGVNLRCADLRDAILYAADLKRADLVQADLRGANLECAYLWATDLGNAKLEGANFTKTLLETKSMTTKTQLQSKIQELEAELQQFKEQLNNYKEHPTIEEANVGDVLEDGSIVVKKENGLALLAAPLSTEVCCAWSKEFTEVFEKLKEEGFNPSQWFIPTVEQLKVAYMNLDVRKNFSAAGYWSSTEIDATSAYNVRYNNGTAYRFNEVFACCVRAFRCVTY